MPRLLALLALCSLLPAGTGAAPVSARTPVPLTSIHMVTARVGWAIGGARNPVVLRTTDGGHNWTRILAAAVGAGAFVDSRSARVAATHGYGSRTVQLYRTDDAGVHWNHSMLTVPAMSTGSILQLDFPTRSQGWLLAGVTPGMGHLVYSLWHSTDGGSHWTEVADDTEARRSRDAFPGCNCIDALTQGISFRSGGNGWVTGEPFATNPPWIYVTHNAGQTWSAQRLPRDGGRVVVVTHDPVFVGGGTGYLPVQLNPPGLHRAIVAAYVTRNGGRTWMRRPPIAVTQPAASDALGLTDSFVGSDGWLALDGRLWRSTDGARHWHALGHPANWPSDVSELQFLNVSVGFALPYLSSTRAPTYLLETTDGGRTWMRVSAYRS